MYVTGQPHLSGSLPELNSYEITTVLGEAYPVVTSFYKRLYFAERRSVTRKKPHNISIEEMFMSTIWISSPKCSRRKVRILIRITPLQFSNCSGSGCKPP